MSVLNIQPMSKDSVMPTYHPDNSYVLYANEDTQLAENKVSCIRVGFRLFFPPSYCALNVRYKDLKMLGGLIDSDFRGEITAICISPDSRLVRRGEPVARMVILEIGTPEIEDVSAYLESESNESQA